MLRSISKEFEALFFWLGSSVKCFENCYKAGGMRGSGILIVLKSSRLWFKMA